VQDPEDAHKRKPWLAAALNLVPLPLSLGYAYLDLPVRFAVSLVARCIAATVNVVYLARFVQSCETDVCTAHAGEWTLIIGPPLFVIALTAWDAWSVAQVHSRTEPPQTDESLQRRRRSGPGTLFIVGTFALLALRTLMTGDAFSALIIIAVAGTGWLLWRRKPARWPDGGDAGSRPPRGPTGPTP